MIFIRKKLIVALAAVALSGSATSGNLDDMMGDMFMMASTNPQPYSSNTRNGMFGGSLSIRVPVKNYTLMSYDAPTVSMGCSGISLSAGSFSIMNEEQFKQMIRQIGASAGMYFFKLALDQISPNIMRTLNGLEDFMSKFTLNNINTCKVGESLGKSAFNKEFNDDGVVEALKKDWGSAVSLAKGAAEDFTAIFNKGTKETTASAGGPENLPMGNLIWRSLFQKDVANSIGANNITRDKPLLMEYLQSMIGIFIVTVDNKNPDGTEATCGAVSCIDKNNDFPVSPTIGLNVIDFLEGGNGSKKYWECGGSGREEMECQKPEPKVFEFVGTRKYVHKILYGVDEGNVVQPGSLVANLQNGDELTQEQLSLLMVMPSEFMNNFVFVQKSPQASSLLVKTFEGYMAHAFAMNMVDSFLGAIRLAYTGKSGNLQKFALTKQQYNELEKREREAFDLRQKMIEAQEESRTVVQQARNIAATQPKLFYTPFKG